MLTPIRGNVPGGEQAGVTVSLDGPVLDKLIVGQTRIPEQITAGYITITGDPKLIADLMSLLDQPDNDFPIISPRQHEQ